MAAPAVKSSTSHQAPTLAQFYDIIRGNARDGRPDPQSILEVVEGHEARVNVLEPESHWIFNLFSTPSPDTIAARRRTWEAFERAILQENPHDQIRHARLRRMEDRYLLNFEYLKQNNRPLTVEHVEKFAVANAKLFIQDLRWLAEGQNVNVLTCGQIRDRLRAIQNIEFTGRCNSRHETRGGPDSCSDIFWHDPFKLDRKRVHLSQPEDVEQLMVPTEILRDHPYLPQDLPWINRLAMVFTSMEMEIGELIPAPSNGGVDYYEVYEEIATGDGLVAYALRSIAQDSTLLPIIVFRPSQMTLVAKDAVETLFNDMEANIGESGYLAARALFERLVGDPIHGPRFHNNQKIRLIGYSLGSSQAQRFLREFWRHVDEAILINGPSIDRATAQAFADEMNHLNLGPGEDPLGITIYRNAGDIADRAGETHLGWGIRPEAPVQINLVEFRNAPSLSRLLGSHSYRPLEPGHLSAFQSEAAIGYPHCYPRAELDQQLDNFQRGPEIEWYERTRQFWGTQVLYNVVYGLYVFIRTILRCFGIELFRSSRQ